MIKNSEYIEILDKNGQVIYGMRRQKSDKKISKKSFVEELFEDIVETDDLDNELEKLGD